MLAPFNVSTPKSPTDISPLLLMFVADTSMADGNGVLVPGPPAISKGMVPPTHRRAPPLPGGCEGTVNA